MRLGFSILKEIMEKRAGINESIYGIEDFEFHRMIRLLEKKGYVERVLRAGDLLSLRPARLTEKGQSFLADNSHLGEEYPDNIDKLKEWIRADELYSNDVEAGGKEHAGK